MKDGLLILTLSVIAAAAFTVGDFDVRDALTWHPNQWPVLFAVAVLKLVAIVALRVAAKPAIALALFTVSGWMLAVDAGLALPMAEAMAAGDPLLLFCYKSVVIGLNVSVFVLSSYQIMPERWGLLRTQSQWLCYTLIVCSMALSIFAVEYQQTQVNVSNDIDPRRTYLLKQAEQWDVRGQKLESDGHKSINDFCDIDPRACGETANAYYSKADAARAEANALLQNRTVKTTEVLGGYGAFINGFIRVLAFCLGASLMASLAFAYHADYMRGRSQAVSSFVSRIFPAKQKVTEGRENQVASICNRLQGLQNVQNEYGIIVQSKAWLALKPEFKWRDVQAAVKRLNDQKRAEK